jgi:hypothetical protein
MGRQLTAGRHRSIRLQKQHGYGILNPVVGVSLPLSRYLYRSRSPESLRTKDKDKENEKEKF